jgi:peptidoglycan/xylan/chitin deacetylase (PgdA/CDA1 family)
MFYLVKTPWLLRKLYPSYTWQIPSAEKNIYLTFDDGPHPTATSFALDQLKQFNAKATFFCIGKNVVEHPHIYQRIIEEGHSVGNHTNNHLNGWKNDDEIYFNNIQLAETQIQSKLFRPPYGRIKLSQAKWLQKNKSFNIIMWSILSGDFDTDLSPEKCLSNIINNTKAGNIIVMHDSEKAWKRMEYALPATLDYFTKKGFNFKKIET